MTETYTRDSDNDWETIPPNRIDYQQPGYEYRYQKRKLKPIDENPMPEIRLGDYISHLDVYGTWREGIVFYIKDKYLHFANKEQTFIDFLIKGVTTIRRAGELHWEAKK